MPIGSGAVFAPANISPNPGNNIYAKMPGMDTEKIVMTPTAPLTTLNYSSAGWSGANRCGATGGLVVQVPMPSNYIIPNSNLNSSASFLLADGHTIVQTQPVARCTAGASGTSMAKFANVDLYGPGITGAHGGSGLSAIGGSIRLGELRPGTTTGPAHALKVNVYAKEALYKCTTRTACYRWPAVTSDSYSVGWYGAANNNTNTNMKMGALLAIPPSTNITALGLETTPGKQLAWTLQNYGAYIVDDTYAPGFDFNVEDGPSGSKPAEFQNDWGFAMEQRANVNSAWVRDIQRLVKALYVVTNNSSTAIGGGGTPRQPLAPALGTAGSGTTPVSPPTGSTPVSPPPPTGTWTACAAEGGTCSFSGTAQVRYGANGVYATKTVTGPVACTNAVFGDPIKSTTKSSS